jgi:hypothetical protein
MKKEGEKLIRQEFKGLASPSGSVILNFLARSGYFN